MQIPDKSLLGCLFAHHNWSQLTVITDKNELQREYKMFIFIQDRQSPQIISFTCLHPTTTGIIHSGSVAWVDSSTKTDLKRNFDKRGSPAPTHVVHITSAFCRKMSVESLLRENKRGKTLGKAGFCLLPEAILFHNFSSKFYIFSHQKRIVLLARPSVVEVSATQEHCPYF